MAEYVCLDCECQFNEPKKIVEMHGFTYGPGEEFLVCPSCEGNGFVKAVYCDHCGEVILGDYIKTRDGDIFCECCYTTHSVTDL